MKRKSWFRKLFSGRQRSLRTGLVPASVFEVSGAEPARSRKRAGRRSRAVAGPGGGLASFLSVYGTCVLLAALTAAIPYAAYLGYRAVVAAGWLAVTEITVEGNDRLSAEAVIQASGVRRGENILYVDEDEVRERLAGLPWIKRLNVERRLPHRLAVRIEERQPAALLVGERTWIVDADGKLVKEMEPQEFDAELLTIAGISAIENGGDVSAVERQAAEALVVVNEYRALGLDGYYQVIEADVDDITGITLVAATGERFVLGVKDYPERLKRLQVVLSDLAAGGSPVEVVRLDNENKPWKVPVSGTEGARQKAPAAKVAVPVHDTERAKTGAE